MEYIRNTTLAKTEVRRQRAPWDKFIQILNMKHTGPTQSVQNFKTSKDINETAKIQGNIHKNVFLQYYEKLRNTPNKSEPELEWN
jgi:hypothetical protein